MWQQRLIHTTRGTFEVFEKGSGEPMAITHLYSEFNQLGNSMANPFSEFYHVFLVNLRSAGKSVKAGAPEQLSMDETLKDLEALREALGYEKWAFGGHSTGGMLALKYAINHPVSLTKIIAGGAAASHEYGSDENSIYCPRNPNFKRIVSIMEQLNDPATPIETRQQLGYEWALMSYYSEDKLQEALKKPNSGKTVGERLDYFRKVEYPVFDLRKELKDVIVPGFIYSGKYDSQCPLKFGEEIAELLPSAKHTIFEESNHNPFSEEADKFRDFVEQTVALAKYDWSFEG